MLSTRAFEAGMAELAGTLWVAARESRGMGGRVTEGLECPVRAGLV